MIEYPVKFHRGITGIRAECPAKSGLNMMGLINYVLNKDRFESDGNEYFKYMYALTGAKDKYVENLRKAVLVLNKEYDTFMKPDKQPF